MELDYEQYKLVREALHERRIFLQTAPYLSHMLPIMLPIYKWVLPLSYDSLGLMLMHFTKVLANSLLLGWVQDVRCSCRQGEYGRVLPNEQKSGAGGFPNAQE